MRDSTAQGPAIVSTGWPGRGLSATCVAHTALLLACSGPQSALDTAGREAERIERLLVGMSAGALVVWLAFMGLSLYAGVFSHRPHSARTGRRLILIGGAVVPSVVLAALLVQGLRLLPSLLAPAPLQSLKIRVTGEQWWWRVKYLPASRPAIELANEIRLPVGSPVEFLLESRDVIHSFWIPALGGKVDMIPGRRTRLVLTPTRTGTFRGVCAEYCGTSHAWMAFSVVVDEKEVFDRWLARQAEGAVAPRDSSAITGEGVFLASGCGACHTIRGTPADGVLGPDLTHVGGRLSIGAGVLSSDSEALERWIATAEQLKPSVHMPSFGMLPPARLRALARYLDGLE